MGGEENTDTEKLGFGGQENTETEKLGFGGQDNRETETSVCLFRAEEALLAVLLKVWSLAGVEQRRRQDGAQDGGLPFQWLQDLSGQGDQVHKKRFTSIFGLE